MAIELERDALFKKMRAKSENKRHTHEVSNAEGFSLAIHRKEREPLQTRALGLGSADVRGVQAIIDASDPERPTSSKSGCGTLRCASTATQRAPTGRLCLT
eukprot:9468492-Pyramimonas_sp.AAC.1